MKVARRANFVGFFALQLTDPSPHQFVMLSSGSEKSYYSGTAHQSEMPLPFRNFMGICL